ncbi:zinc finger and SCAN domain-containing protein 2 [Drosophila gunungcola]|uniref:zinc finger and SCAN domain-containing protein 2 n=1 Tax=Drosophila gunungcola TaxID=103775 RepID=UPI0022E1097D|nr:zinc finger and SCAN domain-containing protein 2 [Drosophila gunungcola]
MRISWRRMLRHCLANVDYVRLHAQQQLRPKCGEIFYEQEADSFQLVCLLCEMKHFGFEDFARHIRNVHFDQEGRPLTQTVTGSRTGTEDSAQDKASPMVVMASLKEEFLAKEDSIDMDTQAELELEQDLEEVNPLRIMALEDKYSEDEEAIDTKWQPDPGSSSDSDHGGCDLEALMGVENPQDNQQDEDEDHQSVFKKQRQPKDYNCPHCDRKYTTQKYLNTHLKMSHPHPQAFKCGDCEATFDVDRALAQHRRKEHTEFACQLCAKVFKSSRSLLRHVQGHSGARTYKCEHENCGKSFVNQHNLTSHRRVHNEERNYVCELCGYRSRYREALIVHRRTHTGEKPFQCQTCARSFASKSLLNEHQAMHSTEKPYKCDKCDSAFSRPKALYHHKHLHLGVKKFKCKICGNAYAQAAGLSAHMRAHKLQAAANATEGVEAEPIEMLFTY